MNASNKHRNVEKDRGVFFEGGVYSREAFIRIITIKDYFKKKKKG